MIVVAGSVSVPAENSEAFMSAAADVSAASRTLDGNVDYCISMQSPGVFRFLEIWETEEAMMAQFAAPPFRCVPGRSQRAGNGRDGRQEIRNLLSRPAVRIAQPDPVPQSPGGYAVSAHNHSEEIP